MRLYHFTTDAGARGIRESGEIRADLHPVLGEHIAWLTSDPAPKGSALGIARRRIGRITTADRMAQRIEVDTDRAVAWSDVRARFLPGEVQMLESARGARPETWWCVFGPIPVALEAAWKVQNG